MKQHTLTHTHTVQHTLRNMAALVNILKSSCTYRRKQYYTHTHNQKVCVYTLVQDVKLDIGLLKNVWGILYMRIDVNISHDFN